MVRMPIFHVVDGLSATNVGKMKPGTDLDRPLSSLLSKTNLLEHEKLTQPTPRCALYRSGQDRSGQVRQFGFDMALLGYIPDMIQR